MNRLMSLLIILPAITFFAGCGADNSTTVSAPPVVEQNPADYQQNSDQYYKK